MGEGEKHTITFIQNEEGGRFIVRPLLSKAAGSFISRFLEHAEPIENATDNCTVFTVNDGYTEDSALIKMHAISQQVLPFDMTLTVQAY